ncbi:hypothetical protein BDV3_001425 [Batrachochytrium dendrobatidis]|nr:substrate-specific activator of APC-dependent proteolysis [Batrachochytrium dendrobatidis]KAK5668411.1 substrate-specific activator of APC-dependent proteolysis [Batrachochytrium dendrobatidis]OAJ36840.1 hypothetical protein BDEG_20963 [Batrachochytrium dendrobatidis JEL423]
MPAPPLTTTSSTPMSRPSTSLAQTPPSTMTASFADTPFLNRCLAIKDDLSLESSREDTSESLHTSTIPRPTSHLDNGSSDTSSYTLDIGLGLATNRAARFAARQAAAARSTANHRLQFKPAQLDQTRDGSVDSEPSSISSLSNELEAVPVPTELSELPFSSVHKVPVHSGRSTVGSLSRRQHQREISDRFISANAGSEINDVYQYHSTVHLTPIKTTPKSNIVTSDTNQTDVAHKIYQDILKNEMLSPTRLSPSRLLSPTRPSSILGYTTMTPTKRRIFESPSKIIRSATGLSEMSHRALQTSRKTFRHISKTPYKVLDAPELKDDFYLNLVDWSTKNMLGVGLDSCVYLWNASTSKVTKLCDLAPHDSITSVNFIQRGTHVAVGTNRGLVQLWDVEMGRRVRQFSDHQARVGSLAWNNEILTSGSRDRFIHHYDMRIATALVKRHEGHRQEVCGLKWNANSKTLASGGNDNMLNVWDVRMDEPLLRYKEHTAAIKAISWCPHEHGLLTSGGGTADKCIRHWDTLSDSPNSIMYVDTGSQVCNIAWSKSSNELVSTHGYSQNQIVVWKYSEMSQVATLTGHLYRVLQLAMSPDGQNIVTGAGDETLRFWSVFNKPKNKTDHASSLMHILR